MRWTAVLTFSVIIAITTSEVYGQQSTSGPFSPAGIDRGLRPPDKSRKVIGGVPSYIWHHGCGPTAAGMVLGFWDGFAFPNLISGSANTQTIEVSEMMATDGGNEGCGISASDHFRDYSCPIDASPGALQPDRSETGQVHANNCLADFMLTSRSANYNYYGWSWFNDVESSLRQYFLYRLPGTTINAGRFLFDDYSWQLFKDQIDLLHPLVLLVDTEGDGWTDHFVTAIGYDEARQEYGIYDTWDHNVHWYKWRKIASGSEWGIFGVTTFSPQIACVDSDSDGYGDPEQAGNQCPDDNCPAIANSDQGDVDGDLLGNSCDPDADADAIANALDNCWLVSNPEQEDTDADSVGNLCDNCPNVGNSQQRDEDYDGVGDLCDGKPHIYSRSCPDAYLGKPYYFQLDGAGGVYPLTWTFLGGDLPFGTSFTGPGGTISGTPTYKAIYYFTVELSDSDNPARRSTLNTSILVTDPPPPPRPCGDADNNLQVTISDAVYLISYVFSGGPAPTPLQYGDTNCSGQVSISDAVYLINYIFAGGPIPCAACP